MRRTRAGPGVPSSGKGKSPVKPRPSEGYIWVKGPRGLGCVGMGCFFQMVRGGDSGAALVREERIVHPLLRGRLYGLPESPVGSATREDEGREKTEDDHHKEDKLPWIVAIDMAGNETQQ